MNALQLQKLCDASVKHTKDPFKDQMPWSESADPNAWYTTPEFLSLYGMPEYEKLSESQKKKLSFYEAVNFYSLNIHGEKPLIEGLAHRLYRDEHFAHSEYIHHFLDEENDHMVYFGTFCKKYAGKVYRDKKFEFPREFLEGEEDFLFFLKVMIFEEIVDYYNIRMSKDDRLDPLAREINKRHHLDEARHLVFGRNMVTDLFKKYSPSWGAAKIEELQSYIPNYVLSTWKEYYNPEVYEDVGLTDHYDLAERAFAHPKQKAHRKEVTKGCIEFLLENGLVKSEPEL